MAPCQIHVNFIHAVTELVQYWSSQSVVVVDYKLGIIFPFLFSVVHQKVKLSNAVSSELIKSLYCLYQIITHGYYVQWLSLRRPIHWFSITRKTCTRLVHGIAEHKLFQPPPPHFNLLSPPLYPNLQSNLHIHKRTLKTKLISYSCTFTDWSSSTPHAIELAGPTSSPS